MPRATWPPANTAEVIVPADPYVRPEERTDPEPEAPVEDPEPEPEEGE
jgi:hypothetical protein